MRLTRAPVPGKILGFEYSAPQESVGRPFLVNWSAHTPAAIDLNLSFVEGLLRIQFAGLASPALLAAVVPPSGRVPLALPIPNDPGFLGASIDLQALEIKLGAEFKFIFSDNDAVATFVPGIGSLALAEGYWPSTIRGDFEAQLVVDASMGSPLAQTGSPQGGFQAIRHGGQRGFVEGYPADFVETPGTSSIDLERKDLVARRLVNGIQQCVSLPNGFDLAVVRHNANCRDFSLVSIERASGRVRELRGSRVRDSMLSCPPTTRFSLYRPDFAFSDDGDFALCVVRDSAARASSGPPDRLLLVRTDPSKTWTGGDNVVDITPSGAGRFVDGQIALVAGRVVAMAEASSGAQVFEGAADGSAPSAVTLPNGGTGKRPYRVRRAWRASADGTGLAFVLGAATSASATAFDDDVYALRGLGGTRTLHLVSGFTSATALASFRRDTAGAAASRAAISPSGARIAFVSGSGDRATGDAHEIWIANMDGTSSGSASPVLSTRFDTQVDWVGNLRFIDENRLLFLAGEDASACDVYVFDVGSSAITNITKTATGRTTSTPYTFGGSTGNFASRGSFSSRNGRWLYFVRAWGGRVPVVSPPTNNIIAIDTSALSVKDITGNDFGSGGTNFSIRGAPRTTYLGLHRSPRPALELQLRRAPGNTTLAYFVAETSASAFSPSTLHDSNVYRFDIENASVASAVTSFRGSGTLDQVRLISHLTIAPNGDHVAFAMRLGDPSASEDVFVAPSDGSSAPSQLSTSASGQSITDGSIAFVGAPSNALAWTRGLGSISLPYRDVVAEWRLIAGQPVPFALSAKSARQRVLLLLSASPRNP